MAVRALGCVLMILLASSANAAQLSELYRGARENAMGGASTAITEDDEAVFLNPAAMAGNKRAKFYLVNGDLQVSSDTIKELQTSSSAYKNINSSTLQQLLGKNIYGEGTFSPTITLPNFGMAALVDEQFALLAQNLANPNVLLGLQTTSGFQFSSGFSLLRGRRRKDDLRIGFGYKIMFRRGGYHNLTLDQVFNISEQEVKNITGNFGEGMSGDFGMQYVRTVNSHTQLMAGLAYTEIGGMHFNGGGDTQPDNLAIGVGSKFALGRGMSMKVGYDIKHLTQDVEWAKRNHVGFDLALANLDFYGGFNEGRYLTGGAAIDFWLIQLTALTYAEEIGEYSGQMGERRYMLRITIKFDL